MSIREISGEPLDTEDRESVLQELKRFCTIPQLDDRYEFTAKEFAKVTGKSRKTARSWLNDLMELEVLTSREAINNHRICRPYRAKPGFRQKLREEFDEAEESDNELLEKLAALEHKQWSHWIKYLFNLSLFKDDGSAVIPVDKVRLWDQQAETEYENLTEDEKDSDRIWAQKVLEIL